MAVRLPRPHRMDVYIAVAGLLGGLLLWVLDLGTRTARDGLVVLDGRWWILLPWS